MGASTTWMFPFCFFGELFRNAESKSKVFSVGMDLFALYMAELL